ncbi:MAG: hypothetical protein PSX80_17215 [bacterium]|nr:hypothetical protein [bacterium]
MAVKGFSADESFQFPPVSTFTPGRGCDSTPGFFVFASLELRVQALLVCPGEERPLLTPGNKLKLELYTVRYKYKLKLEL